jgi:hypothetical protein
MCCVVRSCNNNATGLGHLSKRDCSSAYGTQYREETHPNQVVPSGSNTILVRLLILVHDKRVGVLEPFFLLDVSVIAIGRPPRRAEPTFERVT